MQLFPRTISLIGRLRLMAALVMIAMAALIADASWSYYEATLEQRLSATRGAIDQSVTIINKYHRMEQNGTMTVEAAKSAAAETIADIRYNGDEYLFINDMNHVMVMHPIKPSLNGQNLESLEDPDGFRLFAAFVDKVEASGSGYVDYLWPKPGSEQPVPKRSFVQGYAPWGWVVGSGVYIDDIKTSTKGFILREASMGTLVILMVFGIVHGLSVSIRRRLHEAEMALQALAQGDLSGQVKVGSRDELGRLLAAVDAARVSLSGIVSQVREASDQIESASRAISTGNADLSTRTEQTVVSLNRTSESVSSLLQTVERSSESAIAASELAGSAAQVAHRGGKVVSEVIVTMEDIRTYSSKIADITGVIDGIAFQTNVLALNAAVEAARAGEQGRGFAVVAGEVGSLAKRSAEAAKEIQDLINTSVTRVQAGSDLVAQAGSTMDEIVASVNRVTDTMTGISESADGQSRTIETVNLAVGDLEQMTQDNTSLVEQSAGSAASLQEQAERLTQIVATFR